MPTLHSEIASAVGMPPTSVFRSDLPAKPQSHGVDILLSVTISVLAPALGQHVFFLSLQHREPPDFLKVMGKAGFGRKDRQGRVAGHDQALQLVSKQNYLLSIGCQVDFETLLCFRRGNHVSARNGRAPAAGGTAGTS